MKIHIFLCFSSFLKFLLFDFLILDGWGSNGGNGLGLFFVCQRDDQVAFSRPRAKNASVWPWWYGPDKFCKIICDHSGGCCGGQCKIFLLPKFAERCFLTFLAKLIWFRIGDILWHKLEAIQAGIESSRFNGEIQLIQRLEETFENRDSLNFLAETGGGANWSWRIILYVF